MHRIQLLHLGTTHWKQRLDAVEAAALHGMDTAKHQALRTAELQLEEDDARGNHNCEDLTRHLATLQELGDSLVLQLQKHALQRRHVPSGSTAGANLCFCLTLFLAHCCFSGLRQQRLSGF